MKEIMIRIQMENKVEHLLQYTDDKNCKIEDLFCNSHEWGEIVIDKKFVDANETEWKSLLFIMGTFRETKYQKDERGYTFQTVESIKKLCAIQNKPFMRSLEAKIFPVSLSRSTDDIDKQRENFEDIIPDDIDKQRENVEDIVPTQDLLKYIKLSKKLKSLEESRHLDKIHLQYFRESRTELTTLSTQIPDQPERLTQLSALITHIDESEKSVRMNSEKTVHQINSTSEEIEYLKSQSEAVISYVGNVAINQVRGENTSNVDRRESSYSDYDEEEKRMEVEEARSDFENLSEENHNIEEYDDDSSRNFYSTARCGEFDPNIVIGARIQVYWAGDDEWYRGRIVEWSESARKYLIEYDKEEDMAPMGENLTGPDAEEWNYITYETRRNPKKQFKTQQTFDESWDY